MEASDSPASTNQEVANHTDQSETTTEGQEPVTTRKCRACFDAFEIADLKRLRCGHFWCPACIEKTFALALKDETAYPPRCCHRIIILKDAREVLPKALVREYQSRREELETKDKTYCYKPECSTFISPHSIHNNEAICQKCNARTCAKCRGKSHFGPCSDAGDPAFMEFAKENTWKRCPTCRRMVEKDEGCDEMLCRCGCIFCYGCGNKLFSCECIFSDEESIDESVDLAILVEAHRQERHQDYERVSDKGHQFTCELCKPDRSRDVEIMLGQLTVDEIVEIAYLRRMRLGMRLGDPKIWTMSKDTWQGTKNMKHHKTGWEDAISCSS